MGDVVSLAGGRLRLPPRPNLRILSAMIDHISLRVRDLDRAIAFYKLALAPLGYQVLMEFPGAAGLGVHGKPDFWLTRSAKTAPTHIAFAASRDAVARFYEAALAAGGEDHGAPGLRPNYHPSYYGAFVLDAEGNNIEAVCHAPAAKSAPAKKVAAKKAAAKKAAVKKVAVKKIAAKTALPKKPEAEKVAAKKAAPTKAKR